jgi:hypothetical protein
MKIKPYLRKLSLKEENAARVDLSKSYAENEALTGLGIHDFSGSPILAGTPRNASDVRFEPVNSGRAMARSSARTLQRSDQTHRICILCDIHRDHTLLRLRKATLRLCLVVAKEQEAMKRRTW